jgi:two-component system, sensor histidine kinase LadS
LKLFLSIFIIFISTLFANSIDTNKFSSKEILSSSQIFIDESKTLTIKEISNNHINFSDINSSIKRFGYSPNFNVWIKFTIHNTEDEAILKILEFDNSLVTNIVLYENELLINKEGLLNKKINRRTVNPIFSINLDKNETKTYYMEVYTKKTSLTLKLNLYSYDDFYTKEIFHQIILSLFFGAMIILALYNLSIYFLIKDISYLYYVAYIITLVLHHLLYVGFANLYIFNLFLMQYIVNYAAIFIALPVLFLSLFSKSFLQTSQYHKINLVLNFLIALLILSVIFFISTDYFEKYRNVVPILIMIYLFFITLYSFIKKNTQAKLILFGWTAILFAGLIMYLSSSGINSVDFSSYYIVEISFIVEALMFSIALANRMKRLQEERNKMQTELIEEQKNIEKTLNTLVIKKTYTLKIALEEKEILLKELNHRVKNNMQTIISLIRLQNDEIEDCNINMLLSTIQNRISAMSHLHELLYQKDNITFIDANEYFERIVYEIQQSFEKNIEVEYYISSTLSPESAIYCGLIINELITNSFKHAFNEYESAVIKINFFKNDKEYLLLYSDNGKGYNTQEKRESLGLILIETLAKKQLKANLKITSNNGVNVQIKWKE